MKFKELPKGKWFFFSSETDPRFRFSGLAKGPWVKLSPRKYRREGFVCLYHRVGSVNVEVIPYG